MVQTVPVTFIYVTDRSSIQLIKLSDLVQGHLTSDLWLSLVKLNIETVPDLSFGDNWI